MSAELDDDVDRGVDLVADRAIRHVDVAHRAKGLQARERVLGRVRVHRRERALVTGVHRLEHVQRLAAATLTDDDPVGAHTQ